MLPTPKEHLVGLLVNRRQLKEDSVFLLALLFIYCSAARAVDGAIDDAGPTTL